MSRSCTLHRVYRLRPCIWMREATRWIKLACRLSLIHALLSSDLAYPVQALCFQSQSSQALLKASPLTTECTIRLMSPHLGVRACSLPGARHQRTLLGFHPEATVALLNNPPLSRRQGSVNQPHRTLSTCTTVGSSPAASVMDGDKEVPSSPIPKSS